MRTVLGFFAVLLTLGTVKAELPRYQHIDMFVSPCAPRAAPKTMTKPAPAVVRSYSMVYNIEGDWSPSDAKIARHVRQVHGIDPTGMTRAQMLMAHDRAHGVSVRIPRQQSTVSSSCPGGVCPTSRSSRTRR